MGHDHDCVGETSVGYCPPEITTAPTASDPETIKSPSEAILAAAEAAMPEELASSGDQEQPAQAEDLVVRTSEPLVSRISGDRRTGMPIGETVTSVTPPLTGADGGCGLDEYISMQDLRDDTLESCSEQDDWLDKAYGKFRTGCCWPWTCCSGGEYDYHGLPEHDEFDLTTNLAHPPSEQSKCSWCSCNQSMSCCGDRPVMSSWCLFQVHRLLPESVAESMGWGRWGWLSSSK